ncbi:zinc finger CCCH domain-containing protein 44-like [Dorcoceras hygrometricum]|uniref:Zinc finger CCCH domain-containing protein 44-like n=1 Tax=Dorcoceras hygrometricum TaxID=472368 RepID=A0A2Z7BMN6_9LAMI|nr:zinc finger CCCH domain-containing protein 44-like [Dorcoceras hygrometricum]
MPPRRMTTRQTVAVDQLEQTDAAQTEPQAPGSDQFHEETGTSNWIQLAVGPQPLRLRNHNFRLAHRIMVKRLETSPHDPLGNTDSACKKQLVVVSVQYGPFNTYIPISSTTIGKSRVARDPIAMHTSWSSNSDIASVTSIGYPRMRVSGEFSTTKHRLLHASGSHPIPPPNDPNSVDLSVDHQPLGYSFEVLVPPVIMHCILLCFPGSSAGRGGVSVCGAP